MIDQIFKTIPIKGKYCHLYPVEVEDAKLIFDLRTERGEHLKKIGATVEDQKMYLQKYLVKYEAQEEIYFKMWDWKVKKFVGVTRFTELDNRNKFGFESGVMRTDSAPNIYIDAMFIIMKIGFDFLNKKYSGPWLVDSKNERMIKFHLAIGIAKLLEKNNDYHVFHASRDDYYKKVAKFEKLGFGKITNLKSG